MDAVVYSRNILEALRLPRLLVRLLVRAEAQMFIEQAILVGPT